MTDDVITTSPPGETSSIPSVKSSDQLLQWVYQLIRPYTKGGILEVGSGDGDMASLFVLDKAPLSVSDPHARNCYALKKMFEGEPLIQRIRRIDLLHKEFNTKYERYLDKFDTVMCLHSIDHQNDHSLMLNNAKKLLSNRGRLIVLLPAWAALFGESDEGFHDWLKCNHRHLRKLLGRDVEFLNTQYFTLLKPPIASNPPVDQYHQEVPIFEVSEKKSLCRRGLSVIVVARIIK